MTGKRGGAGEIGRVVSRLLEDGVWRELRKEHGEKAVEEVRSALRGLAGTRRALRLYSDGGSHGNPGPSGAGGVILDGTGREVERYRIFLGTMTNNRAEYEGLIEGLDRLARLGGEEVDVFLDSELLVKQLTGVYRVRSADLIPLYEAARERISGFRECRLTHIPREENTAADLLAQQAIAEGTGGREPRSRATL